MPVVDVTGFEAALTKIPGIQRARIVGDPEPKEIHLVSTKERAPKQLVRDVQSLATATFGLQIDHRIVSIVQLDSELPKEASQRPSINNVTVASTSGGGRVDVELKWPDGRTTSGGSSSGPSREEKSRAAAAAVAQALGPVLAESEATVDIEDVTNDSTGGAVVVRVAWSDKDSSTPLVGAALVDDDIVTATTRAVLSAVNRKVAQTV